MKAPTTHPSNGNSSLGKKKPLLGPHRLTERFVITGLAPELPEDLYHLIKKAVAVRKHLERNRKDKDSKFRLILIESRIHRLSRYYKSVGVLPPTWRYESSTASTMVA